MVEQDSKQAILHSVGQYYSEKLREHGTTSRGVDWNSEESQFLRFSQLLKVIDSESEELSLLDFGCGYGALLDFLSSDYAEQNIRYTGFDISEAMTQAAETRYREHRSARFLSDSSGLTPHDYTVASGIFNVRRGISDQEWKEYIFDQLRFMRSLSVKGFAWNMLTSYSDPEYMRSDLFYSNPGEMFDFCKRNFSKNVALLHDYRLYEFTVIVRLDG
jgi:cyclopropane fatty-acyl-phospholipid synthase-like methyltransferase